MENKNVIIGLGNDIDKLLVQKSRPLFDLWKSNLTLGEFKILDIYLSRINSHDPERRTIVLSAGEVEKALQVVKINKSDLKNRLIHLMGNVVQVSDYETKKGFKLITLFEEAEAELDEYGLWQVKLECTQKAMKYFFNIENLGYFRYKLRCITSITSRYTYIMFNYLESNRFRKTWEIDLEELKKIIGCEKEETYKQYKRLNDLILKKVKKELLEKTECHFNYEPVKKGRNVVAIRFKLDTLSEISIDEFNINQITIEEYQKELDRELWEKALEDFTFTKEEINEIGELLRVIPNDMFPKTEASLGNMDLMKYHYLQLKVKEIERRNVSKPIKHKFSYLITLMKNDANLNNNKKVI